jgi:hypothetical protein
MNTATALTLLGCSGSIFTMLLAPQSASALMPATASDSPVPTQSINNVTPTGSDFSQTAQFSDAMVRQYAQAKFGCTCSNCMKLARQLLQQSSSTPGM